ncbi:MAG: hypothetical protein ACI30P_06270 [Muribaculaceae bacterium]
MSNEPRTHENERKGRRTKPLMVAGVVILIALLLFWLSWAFFLGDTDVAASIAPLRNVLVF